MKLLPLIVGLFLSQVAWGGPPARRVPVRDLSHHLQPAVFALTMVMIHDVVNPPAASRFYTYCLLGAHEIVAQHQKRCGVAIPGLSVSSARQPSTQQRLTTTKLRPCTAYSERVG